MKTFKKFIDEAYIKSKESGDFKVKKSSNTFLNENRLTDPLDVMIIRQGGKEFRIPTNPPKSFPVDLVRPDLNNPSSRPTGSQRPLPTSSRRSQAARQGVEYARERLDRSRRLNSARAMARTDSTIGRTGRSFAAARELESLRRIPSRFFNSARNAFKPSYATSMELRRLDGIRSFLANRSPIALGAATVLNTKSQEDDAARYQKATGGVRPGEIYKSSDVDSKGMPKKGATPQFSKIGTLSPNTNVKKVISDVGGANNKVSTNTKYNAKIGGVEGTSIRGEGGQRMLRATLGAKSAKDKPSFNLFNTKTWGSPKVGTRYAATLGGHKGTVTYDSKGNRKFEALARPKK